MINGHNFVAFLIASFAIIIVPGPSVLFTLARGVAWGRGVAVLTVLGNTLGTLVLSTAIAVGLGPLLAASKLFSVALQFLGGAYLLYLGAQAFAHRREHAAAMTNREGGKPPWVKAVRDGFVVGILNPKSLVFFGAVFPHFVDRTRGNETLQLLVFGAVFCVMAFLSDGTWGVVAGTAREWLSDSPRRLVVLRTIGATVMTCLGILIFISAVRA